MKLSRKFTGLAVLAGLIGLLLVATTSAVVANTPTTAEDARLDLTLSGNSGIWTLNEGGTDTDFQGISKSGACRLSTDDDLVGMVGNSGVAGAFAGIFKGEAGVKDSSEGNGSPCARIDSGQDLTLSLGPDVSDTYAAYAGTLLLSFKFNATATISLYLGEPAENTLVRSFDQPCVGGNDCGPDSDLEDTIAVDIDEVTGDEFDTIVISTDGAVSLISPNRGDTHLHLRQVFDGILACGDEIETSDGDVAGTIIRVGESATECGELKPYNFFADASVDQIAFLPQGSPGAAYVAKLEFGIAHAVTSPIMVQYDPTGGTTFQPLLACDTVAGSLPATVSTALATLGFDVTVLAGNDIVVPGGESWCEVGRLTYSVGSGQFEDVVYAFGNDDPRFGGI